MTIYTLYVKIHRKTGLKYLGQTSQDPFKYPGSGTDWKIHLKEFGNDIHTEILLQTTDKSERNQWGRYYSAIWHVVTAADDFGNKIWANRIPETGGGVQMIGNTNGFKTGNTHGVSNGFKSGSHNLNYDSCEYTWYHNDSGETVTLTRSELIKKYSLHRGAISRLINKDPAVKSVKGWKIIEK